jgi:hypothetical protein
MARATNPEKPTLAHHNAGRDLHRHRLSYIAVMKFVTKARDTPYKHRKGKIDFFGFVERLRPQKCAAVDFKERMEEADKATQEQVGGRGRDSPHAVPAGVRHARCLRC